MGGNPDKVNFYLSEINRTKGLISIEKLLVLACLSRKQFEQKLSALW